ncbi:MAG: hypothetical protein E7361_03310 [Clostridiales bacterium]|nr:hypothetical protein [Clostridiales bacterium]
MNKKIIILMLLLPLIMMVSIFTSTSSVALNVKVNVSKIEIDSESIVFLDLDKGEKYFVNYAVYPVVAKNKEVVFTSEKVGNEPLAVLEFEEGYIVPKSPGMAKVYLTTVDGGFKDSFIVEVTANSLKSIECSVPSNEMIVGDDISITTQFVPSDVSNKMLSYTSSNPNVASVRNGVIHAESKGTATITVTSLADSNIKDTIDIVVYNEDVLDLSKSEVYTWDGSDNIEHNSIALSVDTTAEYSLSYKVYDVAGIEINNIFQEEFTQLVPDEDGRWKFNYKFVSDYIGSVVVKFTITIESELYDEPIVKECLIHRVDEITASYNSNDEIVRTVGDVFAISDYITIMPDNVDVIFNVKNNSNIANNNGILTAEKPCVTNLEITIVSDDEARQSIQLPVKTLIIKPKKMVINELANTYGDENIWSVGQFEANNILNTSGITVSLGGASVGERFYDHFSYITSNANVELTADGVIKITDNNINDIVNVWAMFKYGDIEVKSTAMPIRCVGGAINVRNFADLYSATRENNNKKICLQTSIEEGVDGFGYINGAMVYTESNVTKITSTYDIQYYKNITGETDLSKIEEAKVKVLINFKEDVYGNGYTINAHNVAYGLEEKTGALRNDALFRGPLDFVSVSDSASSPAKVKGQDNISFAIYENVSINNITLQSCNLKDDGSDYDLSDLDYVGTTVEVLGDNVDLNYSRINNGRTVLRIFGDVSNSAKVINVDINKCVLSNAREFIIRMGSNAFVIGSTTNPSPAIGTVPTPAIKSYNNMNVTEKLGYDNEYIKTFVNLKDSILERSGLFCIGIDTHFAGKALADASNYSGFAEGFNNWKDLAKTSYGAKLNLIGDVRMYDWKDISLIDSSTLIEGGADFHIEGFGGDLSFNIAEMLTSLANNGYNTIVYQSNAGGKSTTYVHGGIVLFGGGKNYGVIEKKDMMDHQEYGFDKLNEYEISLSEVDKGFLEMAAGSEKFYFVMYGSNSQFSPVDQENIVDRYAPIHS